MSYAHSLMSTGNSVMVLSQLKLNPSQSDLPLSEAVQVVVEAGSLLATLFPPQDAGGVDDTAIQHRARHECYKHTHTHTHTHRFKMDDRMKDISCKHTDQIQASYDSGKLSNVTDFLWYLSLESRIFLVGILDQALLVSQRKLTQKYQITGRSLFSLI